MDIEELKNKRQLNVQEQNALLKNSIINEACYWRTKGVPKPIYEALVSFGLSLDLCIFLEYEQDFPGCSTDEGLVLTQDGLFYKFEADLSDNHSKLVEFYLIEDITSDIEVCAHSKGTGATWGYLAQEVLNEINDC